MQKDGEQTVNSRLENGTMVFSSKENVRESVHQWLKDGEIDEIWEESENHISYFNGEAERKIFYHETDSVERIRNSMCFDEKVTEFLDIDKLADFIFNCIDVNALAAVDTIGLLWDEPVYDEYGEIEGFREDTKGRMELLDRTDSETDDYVFEVASELLGCNWTEKSAIIVNIGEIASLAEEIASDSNEWRNFQEIFQEAVIQTICHEFRHAVYEIAEFTSGLEAYPEEESEEFFVEKYGNNEALLLMCDKKANACIQEIFAPMYERQKENKEQSL